MVVASVFVAGVGSVVADAGVGGNVWVVISMIVTGVSITAFSEGCVVVIVVIVEVVRDCFSFCFFAALKTTMFRLAFRINLLSMSTPRMYRGSYCAALSKVK